VELREGEMAKKEDTHITVEVVVRTDMGELTRSESSVYLNEEPGYLITQHVLDCIVQATKGAEAAWRA
jgi:hypothetical protein